MKYWEILLILLGLLLSSCGLPDQSRSIDFNLDIPAELVLRSPAMYIPQWVGFAPTQFKIHSYQSGLSVSQNGQVLLATLQSLIPGDQLQIESGTYQLPDDAAIVIQGTNLNPIWIMAAPGAIVTFMGLSTSTAVLQIGPQNTAQKSEYVYIQGIE